MKPPVSLVVVHYKGRDRLLDRLQEVMVSDNEGSVAGVSLSRVLGMPSNQGRREFSGMAAAVAAAAPLVKPADLISMVTGERVNEAEEIPVEKTQELDRSFRGATFLNFERLTAMGAQEVGTAITRVRELNEPRKSIFGSVFYEAVGVRVIELPSLKDSDEVILFVVGGHYTFDKDSQMKPSEEVLYEYSASAVLQLDRAAYQSMKKGDNINISFDGADEVEDSLRVSLSDDPEGLFTEASFEVGSQLETAVEVGRWGENIHIGNQSWAVMPANEVQAPVLDGSDGYMGVQAELDRKCVVFGGDKLLPVSEKLRQWIDNEQWRNGEGIMVLPLNKLWMGESAFLVRYGPYSETVVANPGIPLVPFKIGQIENEDMRIRLEDVHTGHRTVVVQFRDRGQFDDYINRGGPDSPIFPFFQLLIENGDTASYRFVHALDAHSGETVALPVDVVDVRLGGVDDNNLDKPRSKPVIVRSLPVPY